MNPRLPVTPLGTAVLIGAVLTFGVGWWLGWIEFVAIAIGFLLALFVAVPWVMGGGALVLARSLDPERVEAGRPARSILSVTNPGRGASAPRTIVDRIAGTDRDLDVPALAPGATATLALALPTAARGVVPVGPAVITRADPLGLLRRDLGRTEVAELLVHPRVVALRPLRSGMVKDLEGPTFDTSPAGDVAFHALRQYAPGDDIRHIHWMSTARTGTLMVRHYVDNRRPSLAVLVDDDPEVVSPDAFERSLEATASQVMSAHLEGRPLTVWVGDQEVITARQPADHTLALDRLCRSSLPAEAGIPPAQRAARLFALDRDVSALLFLTGSRSSADLLPLVTVARAHGPVVVARFVEATTAGAGHPPAAVPRARVLDCIDLDTFAAAWATVVR